MHVKQVSEKILAFFLLESKLFLTFAFEHREDSSWDLSLLYSRMPRWRWRWDLLYILIALAILGLS